MSAPIKLPIAEFAPDLPDYPGEGSGTVQNVFPRTEVSYGPIAAPVAKYNALNLRCRGGAAFRDSLGNTFIFAGDGADLYLVKSGSATWANASKTAAGYAATDQTWRFAYFNGQVIATDASDNPQVFTLIGDSAFSDLPGSPPRGRYVTVVKNAFVAFGNTYDSTNGNMPQRVWWCAAGNANDWPILGTDDAAAKQSGAVDLLGPGGWVQGFASDLISADALVFQEFAVRRMAYQGPPGVFSFLPVENARGCIAPDSIVVNGGIAYYWGQDGIYACDGAASKAIGAEKVDRFLYGDSISNKTGDLDFANVGRIVGTTDPRNKLIIWAYPSAQNSGNPDKLLIYNWELGRFSLAIVTCETVLKLLTVGYTLDQLETVFGYTVDTIPAPLDSAQWLGGLLQLGLFDATHTLGTLSGATLAATVDTSELQPVPGRRLMIRGARPLVDGTALPSVSIGHRERLQDAVTYTPSVALNSMGACPIRSSGRYLRARVTVPSSSWTNLSGIELDAVPQGTR